MQGDLFTPGNSKCKDRHAAGGGSPDAVPQSGESSLDSPESTLDSSGFGIKAGESDLDFLDSGVKSKDVGLNDTDCITSHGIAAFSPLW
jgi:hypothetical protein